jgi:two-component system sensor histidine kinase VicK
MSNSLKFTFNGYIKLKAQIVRDFNGSFVQISVEDTGIGIKDKDKSKLFQLFANISENSTNPNGTGIGLTICKKYLEKLQGSIWAESEYGKGTQVSFNIPLIFRSKGVLEGSEKFINYHQFSERKSNPTKPKIRSVSLDSSELDESAL